MDKLYGKRKLQDIIDMSEPHSFTHKISQQLLDTMREKEQLRKALSDIAKNSEDVYADQIARTVLGLKPYKDSSHE
jgi:hypothetical protein